MGKERLLPLPQSIYPLLKEYIHFYQPTTYLFEGQKSDQYSPTSVAKIVQRAAKMRASTNTSPLICCATVMPPIY